MMDVAKYEGHTPGPWRKLPEEVDKPYIRIRGTMLGGRYKVANVLTPVYEGVPEREAKETRANAALIEDAPLLLAEVDRLQKLADAISRDCNDCANQRNKAQSELATERARYAELVAVLRLWVKYDATAEDDGPTLENDYTAAITATCAALAALESTP